MQRTLFDTEKLGARPRIPKRKNAAGMSKTRKESSVITFVTASDKTSRKKEDNSATIYSATCPVDADTLLSDKERYLYFSDYSLLCFHDMSPRIKRYFFKRKKKKENQHKPSHFQIGSAKCRSGICEFGKMIPREAEWDSRCARFKLTLENSSHRE